jgi:pSer/pThr/pTyr-binding forkhead associated (FHA) protein
VPFLRYQDGLGVHYVELGKKDRLVIGRDKGCDVALNDTQASRQHCEIKKLPGGFLVNDLNSKNGTLINGKKVGSWTLKDDDVLTVGGTVLVYRLSR